MLDYWRPKLCPFDHDAMLETVACLEVFLPITLPPEKSEFGYKLWLDELMDLWKTCHNSPGWERVSIYNMKDLFIYFEFGWLAVNQYINACFKFTKFVCAT